MPIQGINPNALNPAALQQNPAAVGQGPDGAAFKGKQDEEKMLAELLNGAEPSKGKQQCFAGKPGKLDLQA